MERTPCVRNTSAILEGMVKAKPNRQGRPGNTQNDPSQNDPFYWTNAHTKHRLRVHLVWVPKYRKRVLQGQVALRLEELLRQAAQVNCWQVHELAIQPDHVHLPCASAAANAPAGKRLIRRKASHPWSTCSKAAQAGYCEWSFPNSKSF